MKFDPRWAVLNDAHSERLHQERRAHVAEAARRKLRNPDSPLPPLSSPRLGFGSRRRFLRLWVTALGAFALWTMDRLANRTAMIPEEAEITREIPWSPTQEVLFHGDVIVVNGAQGVAVYSARCPHLGCQIGRAEGGELVCPCHGSRFDLEGRVVHGPAARTLEPLPFTLDRTKGMLHVTLRSSV